MNKPYLIITTGRPGSGKTTFAKALSNELFMPVINRDQMLIPPRRSHDSGNAGASVPGK